jgi:micrococcal nuclease
MFCCAKNKLLKLNNEDIPLFTFNGYTCLAKIVDVYDGDTFTGCFKYNGKIMKYKFRTYGYDSPEMKPLKSKHNRDEEKKKAVEAREAFKQITNWNNSLVLLKMGKFDKYGRILVNVYKGELDVNEWMIKNGYGYRYYEGTKK